MPYTILKSKYRFLNLLLNSKKQQSNSEEYITISDEEYNKLKSVDPTLNCEFWEPYTLVMTDENYWTGDINSNEHWFICPQGPSYWNINMGGYPKRLRNDTDGYFIRFGVAKTNDEYLTSGFKTREAYGDGIFECEARFKGGRSTWPAIWLQHPHGSDYNYAKYYEIDISEYYETRDQTETTYHYPKEMRNEANAINAKTNIIKDYNQNGVTAWNKFKCSWDETSIIIYINDAPVLTIENNGDPMIFPQSAEDRTFQFILSMQYAGNPYLNTPDDNEFPLYMDVRNIRYWRKNNNI